MRSLLTAACVVLTVSGCASQPDTAVTPRPAADPRAAEMQVTMTELLEQLDVLNARVARLESGAPAQEARRSEPALVVEPPPSPMVAATQRRPQEPAVQPAPPRPSNASLAAAQVAESYRAAIVLFGKGRLAEARAGFQKVFDAEPSGELADNALFWIGETYFSAGNAIEATRYYKRVTTEFADQNKAPDAMYKIALAHEKSGDLALARQTLQELIRIYPYSSSADSAKRELERIKY
jgi:tol-pal system protein YbgF